MIGGNVRCERTLISYFEFYAFSIGWGFVLKAMMCTPLIETQVVRPDGSDFILKFKRLDYLAKY